MATFMNSGHILKHEKKGQGQEGSPAQLQESESSCRLSDVSPNDVQIEQVDKEQAEPMKKAQISHRFQEEKGTPREQGQKKSTPHVGPEVQVELSLPLSKKDDIKGYNSPTVEH